MIYLHSKSVLTFVCVFGAAVLQRIYLYYIILLSPVSKGSQTIKRSPGLVSDLTCSSQAHHDNRDLHMKINPSVPEAI